MIWGVSSWKTSGHKHLIFIILVTNLSICLLFFRFVFGNDNFMPKLIALVAPYIWSFSALEWWMICLATVLTGVITPFQRSSLILKLININLLLKAWFFLKNFFLSFSESLCLVGRAPYTKQSCLISLCCSWACKACQSSFIVILDRSFIFSKVVINSSYLSGTVTSIFSTFLEFVDVVPSNLTLLTIASNLFEYSLIVSDYFILCSSNSLIKLSININHIIKPHITA